MRKTLLALLLVFVPALHAHAGETYDRVMKSGTIRCGYAIWKPVLYADPNTGEIKGLIHDLMEEAGKRLDLKVEWTEETGWGTLIEGLNTNRYDAICTGLYRSSVRAKFISFGTPVFYSPLYVIVKKDNHIFDKDVSLLNDPAYKIVVLEGEISSIAARQIFPKASTYEMPQMQEFAMLVKDVEAGKGDATLTSPEMFLAYDKSNPGLLRMLNKEPVNIFPTSVGLPINDVAFNNMINVTFEELHNDGTIGRLLKKYEEYPGTFLSIARPYETAE